MTENEVQVCFINEFPSVLEGIFSLTGVSKSQIKKKIDRKFLNKPVKKKLEVTLPLSLLNYGKINTTYTGPDVRKINEDENFLVLEKPSKVHCHPLGYDESDNILSYLATVSPKILEVNKHKYDRGLFYRLDYETSGILYFAKTDEIQKTMRDNFSDLIKEKIYYAVVDGRTKEQEVLIHHLSSYSVGRSMVKVDKNGERCELSFRRVEYNESLDLSLLKIYLKQGHRHQIRVQLQSIGHPILGDPLYSDRIYDRLMLHCYQYRFYYAEKEYDFKCDFIELKDLFTYFHCKL